VALPGSRCQALLLLLLLLLLLPQEVLVLPGSSSREAAVQAVSDAPPMRVSNKVHIRRQAGIEASLSTAELEGQVGTVRAAGQAPRVEGGACLRELAGTAGRSLAAVRQHQRMQQEQQLQVRRYTRCRRCRRYRGPWGLAGAAGGSSSREIQGGPQQLQHLAQRVECRPQTGLYELQGQQQQQQQGQEQGPSPPQLQAAARQAHHRLLRAVHHTWMAKQLVQGVHQAQQAVQLQRAMQQVRKAVQLQQAVRQSQLGQPGQALHLAQQQLGPQGWRVCWPGLLPLLLQRVRSPLPAPCRVQAPCQLPGQGRCRGGQHEAV